MPIHQPQVVRKSGGKDNPLLDALNSANNMIGTLGTLLQNQKMLAQEQAKIDETKRQNDLNRKVAALNADIESEAGGLTAWAQNPTNRKWAVQVYMDAGFSEEQANLALDAHASGMPTPRDWNELLEMKANLLSEVKNYIAPTGEAPTTKATPPAAPTKEAEVSAPPVSEPAAPAETGAKAEVAPAPKASFPPEGMMMNPAIKPFFDQYMGMGRAALATRMGWRPPSEPIKLDAIVVERLIAEASKRAMTLVEGKDLLRMLGFGKERIERLKEKDLPVLQEWLQSLPAEFERTKGAIGLGPFSTKTSQALMGATAASPEQRKAFMGWISGDVPLWVEQVEEEPKEEPKSIRKREGIPFPAPKTEGPVRQVWEPPQESPLAKEEPVTPVEEPVAPEAEKKPEFENIPFTRAEFEGQVKNTAGPDGVTPDTTSAVQQIVSGLPKSQGSAFEKIDSLIGKKFEGVKIIDDPARMKQRFKELGPLLDGERALIRRLASDNQPLWPGGPEQVPGAAYKKYIQLLNNQIAAAGGREEIHRLVTGEDRERIAMIEAVTSMILAQQDSIDLQKQLDSKAWEEEVQRSMLDLQRYIASANAQEALADYGTETMGNLIDLQKLIVSYTEDKRSFVDALDDPSFVQLLNVYAKHLATIYGVKSRDEAPNRWKQFVQPPGFFGRLFGSGGTPYDIWFPVPPGEAGGGTTSTIPTPGTMDIVNKAISGQ